MRYLFAGGADFQAFPASPKRRFMGYTVRNIGTTAAQVILRNGTGGGDPALATVNLPVNGSANGWATPGGELSPNGIFLDVVSGNVQMAIYAR